MTEEQAKTKWCPFARVATSYNNTITPGTMDALAAVNRPTNISDNPIDTRCIGSECMAWRWNQGSQHIEIMRETGNETKIYSDLLHGHCGLAGIP